MRRWDVLGDVRSLRLRDVGYDFTDYSDDLTDQSYRSRGVFVDLVGQK